MGAEGFSGSRRVLGEQEGLVGAEEFSGSRGG